MQVATLKEQMIPQKKNLIQIEATYEVLAELLFREEVARKARVLAERAAIELKKVNEAAVVGTSSATTMAAPPPARSPVLVNEDSILNEAVTEAYLEDSAEKEMTRLTQSSSSCCMQRRRNRPNGPRPSSSVIGSMPSGPRRRMCRPYHPSTTIPTVLRPSCCTGWIR